MITVYCEYAVPDVDDIVKNDQSTLLERKVSVARGIVLLELGKPHVLVTNFTEEYQHFNKGAAIAFLEEIHEAGDMIAAAGFERAPEDAFKLPRLFDVNPALPQKMTKKLAVA